MAVTADLEFPLPRKRRPNAMRLPSAAQLPVWTSILLDELHAVPSKPGVYLLKDAGDKSTEQENGNWQPRVSLHPSTFGALSYAITARA